MAGGTGTRFWPKGTLRNPKQFLDIENDGVTLIQKTYNRLEGLFTPTKIFVVTNVNYKSTVKKQLQKMPEENIIIEPFGRNTAPCIGLSCLYIKNFDQNAKILAVPADHIIKNTEKFHKVVNAGLEFVEQHEGIVTLGINPVRPETGYGYIQFDSDEKKEKEKVCHTVYKVKTFAEKPNREVATAFLESGDFLWNAGMFIFRVDVMMREIEKHLPDLNNALYSLQNELYSNNFYKLLVQVYSQIKGISIDYGIMEKSDIVYTIKSDFEWSDVGSWDEIFKLIKKDRNGNAKQGMTVINNSKNCMIINDQRIAAVVGCEDLIIIDTDNGLLVCKRGESQNVREIVDYLRRKGYEQYL